LALLDELNWPGGRVSQVGPAVPADPCHHRTVVRQSRLYHFGEPDAN
jgi:hypothetical protein